jgi:hypothetical protein
LGIKLCRAAPIRREESAIIAGNEGAEAFHRLFRRTGHRRIQWTVARLFEVSLHDLIFGSTTLKINDYPRQLALARMAALYLCRKRT